jgi:phosphohistidine phosphatase
MEIYLLRHGIAEDAKPGHPDSERALTPEGRVRLRRVLKRARSAETVPQVILTSPYRRALQTAEIAADVLRYKGDLISTKNLVPDASPVSLWQEIRDYSSQQSILLASHEPLMGHMVAYLLGAPSLQVDMKKGALVRIDVDGFGAHPRGVLRWMLTPGLCLP